MKINFLIIYLILSLSFSCQSIKKQNNLERLPTSAQSLAIISDVDDTIRISHTGGGVDNLSRVFLQKEIYIGMNTLYRGIAINSNGSQSHFISAAPSANAPGNGIEKKFYKILENTVHGLIKDFNFSKNYTLDFAPEAFGKIKDRKEKLKKVVAYKFATFEKHYQPELQYSLYGDDTEADFLVYEKIKQKYPQNVAGIFIHKVKGNVKVHEGLLYYTAFEPALVEYSLGRLSKQTVLEIGEELTRSNIFFEKIIPQFGICPNAKSEKFWISDLVKKFKIQDANLEEMALKVQANIHYLCEQRSELNELKFPVE
jgi:Uncharacterized conserved protein (DUF2183)